MKRFLSNEGIKRGTPLIYIEIVILPIGSSSVKTVADRRRLAAYITSTANELSSGTNIDDLERH